MVKFNRIFMLAALLFALAGCRPSKYYVPQTEGEAISALDKAVNENQPAQDRLRWAEVALNSNLLRGKDLADAYYYCGIARHDMGQYKNALRDFDEMLRQFPNDGDGYGARGNSLYMLGYYDDAIDDYRKAYRLTKDPTYDEYIKSTAEDKRLNLPPPYLEQQQARAAQQERQRLERDFGPSDYHHELVFVGFYAEKIQQDSVFKPANEVRVSVSFVKANYNKDVVFPSKNGHYGGIKDGTRKFINQRVWRGEARSTHVSVFAEEIDGKRSRNRIGHVQVKALQFPHHQYTQLKSEHGFKYHIKMSLSSGRARYHFYFTMHRKAGAMKDE